MSEIAPIWVDAIEYPFKHRWFDTPDGRLHYIDEGAGEVVLFVHGNPSWSFEFRHVIRALRTRYRCVAIDHLGFGLSDKPRQGQYLPQDHAFRLASFVEHLALSDLTLVTHDWGGPIGMAYAVDHPKNVRRIIASNTWFWSVKGEKHFESFSGLMGGPLGRFLCTTLNFFPKVGFSQAFGDKSKLTKKALTHFVRPFPTVAGRNGPWIFARSIISESAWLEDLWSRREQLRDLPVLLFWGEADDAFGLQELHRWEEAFPLHTKKMLPGVGHFPFEEAGEDAVSPIEAFLKKA